jgi:tetratricopeptide (TPR) repeat protein
MGEVDFGKLRFLVADDFGNFRATVTGMLNKMGVVQVEQVSNANSLIAACEKRAFDVILSDYDLGQGRNGQRVLEELRYRNLISRRSLFVLVSGNASKDVVLAAYDNEPDDYLAKPFTARAFSVRLERLLLQRQALLPAHLALEKGDRVKAVAVLTDLVLANNRFSLAAQKLLGQLFIEQGELDKAERLYGMALQSRPLDWARLGLARVKELRGDKQLAAQWMGQIISDSPLFLPAYDALANNWQNQGQRQQEQDTVQRAVDISPMSILRQKRLAQVAEHNGDWLTALRAWRRALKLGEHSCHGQSQDNLQFAKVAAGALQNRVAAEPQIVTEAVQALSMAGERYALENAEHLQSELIKGRLLALDGKLEQALEHIEKAETAIEMQRLRDVDTDIERAFARLALGKTDEAEAFIRQLLQTYAYDQEALEKLDKLLSEPVSEANRSLVADINREGIELYNQSQYDQAIECFERARKLFPKHLGIQLNIVQALVGKKRFGSLPNHQSQQLEETLNLLGSLMDSEHSQYARYQRLRQLAASS